MTSRNYDNVPPHATNTVTISTSQQVRMAPTGQIRPIGVPMRPQAVPIRKVHHDINASSSAGKPFGGVSSSMQIKQENIEMDDFQGSSSSGALTPGPSSSTMNSFQQYQRGGGTVQGTSMQQINNGNGTQDLAMDQPAPVNLASKVAEVFLTAGHAFQKLGDLTLQLHTATGAEESKWSDKEVDHLRDALTRFAHELDQISTCVANRTTKHIKNDIKRRHMIDDSNHQMKRMAMNPGGGTSQSLISGVSNGATTYGGLTSSTGSAMHAIPLAPKRMAIQPTAKIVGTRAIVPTRYTVGGTSSLASASTSGMPLLQQQAVQNNSAQPFSSSNSSAAPSTSAGRISSTRLVVAPNSTGMGHIKLQPKRFLPVKPASGALVLEEARQGD